MNADDHVEPFRKDAGRGHLVKMVVLYRSQDLCTGVHPPCVPLGTRALIIYKGIFTSEYKFKEIDLPGFIHSLGSELENAMSLI